MAYHVMFNRTGRVREDTLKKRGRGFVHRVDADLAARQDSRRDVDLYFFVIDSEGEVVSSYHRGKAYAGWRPSRDTAYKPSRRPRKSW
jgi:hypothetical protein